MTDLDTPKQLLLCINRIADWRFALGLHIRFANPTLLYQTYPQRWVDYYNQQGLVFVDPAVRWAMANSGVYDWSDLVGDDASNVFGQAADHGLRFGKIISIARETRTFGFFTHPSRSIEDTEIDEARVALEQLHDVTKGAELLSERDLASLRELNALLPRS
jgi:LuxR family transcriptional regulator, quorum-sensing system regulator SdiA